MKKTKTKIGRPLQNKRRKPCEIFLEVWEKAESARLNQQAKEGMEINKINWLSRLIEEAVKRYQ